MYLTLMKLSSFSDLFPHLCKCSLIRGAGRELHGWTVVEENGRYSCSSVWEGQIEQTKQGDPWWAAYADGSCQPLRAWKNVMALGHGGEVCVIISEAGWFLMSMCHGSLIIHRITDEKPNLKGYLYTVSKFIFTKF